MFILYPGISTSLLSMFYCVPLEDGSAWLRVDFSLRCQSAEGVEGSYAAMLVFTFIMLGVHTIGTPAIYSYLFFWKHHSALEALKEQELEDAHTASIEKRKAYVTQKSVSDADATEVKLRIKPEDVLPGYMLKLCGGYEYRTVSGGSELSPCSRPHPKAPNATS